MKRISLGMLACGWIAAGSLASCVSASTPGGGGAAAGVAPGDTVQIRVPEPEAIRRLPLRSHPRIIATAARFDELRAQVGTDPVLRHWYSILKSRADEYVAERERPEYVRRNGVRLLATARRVLDRTTTLALVARLEEDPRYAARLWEELSTAAAFPDWNPRHFLDVGEMTAAFAIGYDWLYDVWTEEQRAILEEAIAEKGLAPALEAYAGRHQGKNWPEAEDNWTQVTNGGVALGALAILDERPERAAKVLHEGLSRLPQSMRHYAPDGGWNEGPGYWHYGTLFATMTLSALETALGTDFDLSRIPGFSEAGWFAVHMTSTFGPSFAFADVDRHIGPTDGAELLWLARRFDEPAFAAHQLRYARDLPEGRSSAFNLIWYSPEVTRRTAPVPLDRYFRGLEVVAMRESWDDPNAIYVGFKAGDNKAHHGNLDLGSFVLDALGVRWATELGSDSYGLPGYWGYQGLAGQRWTYYRMRAEGQNTLVMDPDTLADQDPAAVAPIVNFESQPDRAHAVADLSAAYAQDARRVRRGIALLDGRTQVLVQDELETLRLSSVWWFMHTEAEVEIAPDGTTATLSRNGERLRASLLSPAGARFSVLPAEPLPGTANPPGQRSNEGIRKLAIRLDGVDRTRVAVLLVPLGPGEVPSPPALRALSEW